MLRILALGILILEVLSLKPLSLGILTLGDFGPRNFDPRSFDSWNLVLQNFDSWNLPSEFCLLEMDTKSVHSELDSLHNFSENMASAARRRTPRRQRLLSSENLGLSARHSVELELLYIARILEMVLGNEAGFSEVGSSGMNPSYLTLFP